MAKARPKNGMRLVLEGTVFMEDTENGVTTREEIAGELVLRVVLLAIEQGLELSRARK